MWKKLKAIIIRLAQFLFNPRFLLCFGMGWMITNGWSYLLLGLGTLLKNSWMIGIASAYLTFLWLPISPEKIITVTIAIFLMKRLFPKDEKTLGLLRELHRKVLAKKKQKEEEKEESSPE